MTDQRCFYCGCRLRRLNVGRLQLRSHPRDLFTLDHIFPQSALRQFRGRVPPEFLRLNKVPACLACNNAKGSMDPVYWAQQLGTEAVVRLAMRIAQMGVPMDYVSQLRSGGAILSGMAAVGRSVQNAGSAA